MRVMLILRGASGSGKSRFVQENKLEPYTISQDNLRVAMYGLERDLSGDYKIPQKYNNKVYRIFLDTLEAIMKEGKFVVIDNTNTDSLPNLKKLCKEYKYRMFVKDFQIMRIKKNILKN